jgi:hypothetical protein
MRTKNILALSLFVFCLIPALAEAQVYTATDLGYRPVNLSPYIRKPENSTRNSLIHDHLGQY